MRFWLALAVLLGGCSQGPQPIGLTTGSIAPGAASAAAAKSRLAGAERIAGLGDRALVVQLGHGLLVVLGGASAVSSQTAQATAPAPDNFVVFAKAGRINVTEGEVRSRRTDGDPGTQVTTGYEITVGDIVSTASGARLEVLLSPGSFLRVGEDAEFLMLSTKLDDVHFVLRRGSALIERRLGGVGTRSLVFEHAASFLLGQGLAGRWVDDLLARGPRAWRLRFYPGSASAASARLAPTIWRVRAVGHAGCERSGLSRSARPV